MLASYSTNYALARAWIPRPGSIVIILVIRVSPKKWIVIYVNDGVPQIVRMVMGTLNLQELYPNANFQMYPAVFTGYEVTRHSQTFETIRSLCYSTPAHALVTPMNLGESLVKYAPTFTQMLR